MVVEGGNDVQFLRRISATLHHDDSLLPNLAELEDRGRVIFIPFGGGHVRAWSHRFSALNLPEFHLYDHELPPETDYRREAADCVNARNQCKAVLTHKRSLENYLHPDAIRSAGGFTVAFDDFDCVAEITAKQLYQQGVIDQPWELHSQRARSRMTNRAKRWLNTEAVSCMTLKLLQERDPEDELIGWLRIMATMIDEPRPNITQETE